MFAIRGTVNLGDVVINARGEPTEWQGHYFHAGYLATAKWLLEEQLFGVMADDLSAAGYSLVFAGHSLGGACATIVSFLMRDRLPASTRVFAYAPPACADESVADHPWTRAHVTGLVLGDDIVPRVSVANASKLTAELAGRRDEWSRQVNLDLQAIASRLGTLWAPASRSGKLWKAPKYDWESRTIQNAGGAGDFDYGDGGNDRMSGGDDGEGTAAATIVPGDGEMQAPAAEQTLAESWAEHPGMSFPPIDRPNGAPPLAEPRRQRERSVDPDGIDTDAKHHDGWTSVPFWAWWRRDDKHRVITAPRTHPDGSVVASDYFVPAAAAAGIKTMEPDDEPGGARMSPFRSAGNLVSSFSGAVGLAWSNKIDDSAMEIAGAAVASSIVSSAVAIAAVEIEKQRLPDDCSALLESFETITR